MSGSRSDRGGKKSGGGAQESAMREGYPDQLAMSAAGQSRHIERALATSALTP
jgi:hypothetical protein